MLLLEALHAGGVHPIDTADSDIGGAWNSAWDDLVWRSDPRSIDQWCTSSSWASSARQAFHPSREQVVAFDEGFGLAMARVPNADIHGGALVPMESVWLFGAPIVGPDPEHAASHAAQYFMDQRREQSIYLGGYVEDSQWWDALIRAFGSSCDLFGGEERARCRASLEGGIDGYLSRRTRAFRRNLRQGERRAARVGIEFEIVDANEPDDLLRRLHRIEQRSWKGMDGSGIEGSEMETFYAQLVPSLSRGRALRACVAKDGAGCDLGFVFGGVQEGCYRGLQLSFAESARDLGVGNLLQWHEIQRLCDENTLTYDIGMQMEYKLFWTEEQFVTRLLFARKSRGSAQSRV